MICISSTLDEIADIWIRRIIKAIRLQLNCSSSGGGRRFLYVSREVGCRGCGVKIQQVCVCACAHISPCQVACGAAHHTPRPVI